MFPTSIKAIQKPLLNLGKRNFVYERTTCEPKLKFMQ